MKAIDVILQPSSAKKNSFLLHYNVTAVETVASVVGSPRLDTKNKAGVHPLYPAKLFVDASELAGLQALTLGNSYSYCYK